MKKLLLLSMMLLLNTVISLQAQETEECASGLIHEKLMQNDPIYAQTILDNEALIQQYSESFERSTNATLLQIPVVVHIIHTGQAVGTGVNISMTQINSAIARMNNRYRNLHGPSVDTEVEFVLAQRDPNGNATTGVVRVDGSGVANYATEGVSIDGTSGIGADEETIKALSNWSNTDYYNIWVVTELEDNDGGFGFQGFAYYPGARPAIDGTIIMHTCFGTIGTVNSWNNQGRTLVHELGHAFNLAHTFNGDEDGTICPPGNGDNVADTDPHIRAPSNCPTGTNACTGNSIAGVTSNFMNYSSQTCALEFTNGQSTRMRAAIALSRPGLTTSLAGTAPAASSAIAATCTPSTSDTSNTYGMGIYKVNMNNIDVVSNGTVNEGDYIDHTKHQTIVVEAGSTYPITINTGGANNENVVVYIDYNNNGDFSDAGETVFNSNGAVTHSGNITIPSSGITANALLRMRIISDFVNFTITSSCFSPTYGQTEDYAIEINSTLSNPEVTLNAISIYPNPTSGSLNINGLKENALAKIFNVSGQLILSDLIPSTNSKIDVSKLSNGLYFLSINGNTFKFIKE